MGEALEDLTENLPPFDIEDFDRILESLPAMQRAQLRWTRPQLLSAVASLRTGEVTPDLLAAAVEDVLAVCGAMLPAVSAFRMLRPPGVGDEMWVRPIEAHWRSQLSRMSDYLADPAATESADYALRAVGAMFAALPFVLPEGPALHSLLGEVSGAKRPAFARSDAAGILCAQLLLMAVLAERRDGHPPQLARDLAHRAFLESQRGVAALRRESQWFMLLAEERGEERNERALRAVARFRETATDADHAAIFGEDEPPR